MRPESFKHWIKRSFCIAFCLALAGLTPQLFADLEALEAEVQADYEQRLGALFEHFHANPELSSRSKPSLPENSRLVNQALSRSASLKRVINVTSLVNPQRLSSRSDLTRRQLARN